MKEVTQEQVYTIKCYSIPLMGHVFHIVKCILPLLQVKNLSVKVLTSSFAIQRLKSKYQKVQFEGINDGITSQEQLLQISKKNKPGYVSSKLTDTFWLDHFSQTEKPNLIICDFATSGPINYAIKNNIKLIVLMFGSLDFYKNFSSIATFKNSFQFCGLTVLYPSWRNSYKGEQMGINILNYKSLSHGLNLHTSFFGFQQSTILPPNVQLIGPIVEQNFQRDIQLVKWMHKQIEQEQSSFVYIAFGTIIQLSQDFINQIYQEVSREGVSIIWSLKNCRSKNLKFQRDNIFVRQWICQQSVLNMENVRVFISHGGWNSLTEGIHYKKPMIILPCFGDQIPNSESFSRNKIGVVLKNKHAENGLKQHKQLSSQTIQKGEVKEAVDNVLNNWEYYSTNVKRLQQICKQMDSKKRIKQAVIFTLKHGYTHLIDKKFNQTCKRTTSKVTIKAAMVLLVVMLIFLYKLFG